MNSAAAHDDIGWTFTDEDALKFDVNGFRHRQFLNRFCVSRIEGSFAREMPFQDNPQIGDCRICGMGASLCGLEQADPLAAKRVRLLYRVILSAGGVTLIYLDDEVARHNDHASYGCLADSKQKLR